MATTSQVSALLEVTHEIERTCELLPQVGSLTEHRTIHRVASSCRHGSPRRYNVVWRQSSVSPRRWRSTTYVACGKWMPCVVGCGTAPSTPIVHVQATGAEELSRVHVSLHLSVLGLCQTCSSTTGAAAVTDIVFAALIAQHTVLGEEVGRQELLLWRMRRRRRSSSTHHGAVSRRRSSLRRRRESKGCEHRLSVLRRRPEGSHRARTVHVFEPLVRIEASDVEHSS